MTTTPIALGQLAKLAFADQAAFATPAATGYRYAYLYKLDLKETRPLDADPIIGGSYNNFRDSLPAAPSLSNHAGSLDIPLCLNGIGDWLKLLFGAPTTTGSTNLSHVFVSGAAQLPSRTIEVNPVAADFRQHVGCVAKNFKLTVKDDKGYQHAAIDLAGRGENMLSTSAAGSIAAARAYDPVKATGGAVLLGGVQIGLLMQASLTYTGGVVLERYVDGTDRVGAAVLSDPSEITGELRVRYNGQTFDALALAETDSALEFDFIRGANNSLTFAMPAVRLGRAGAAIEGPGGVEQTIPFRASQTTGAAMLTATLKNQIATY